MASLLASRSCTAGLVRPNNARVMQPRAATRATTRGPRVIVFATAEKATEKPSKEQVLTSTIAIIHQQLGGKEKDKFNIAAESKFVDLGADSLDTVEIMMALEEKFEIELDEEGAEKISTVQQAADLIFAKVEAK